MDLIKPQPLGLRHVVAMPWPGRGHINPMLNLCKRLVRRDPNLIVTVVVTEEWLGFIGSDPKPNRIHFATLPNLIPSALVRANDFISFVDAVFTRLEEPFEQLLDRLSCPPPNAIIADTHIIWAVRVGTKKEYSGGFFLDHVRHDSLSLHSLRSSRKSRPFPSRTIRYIYSVSDSKVHIFVSESKLDEIVDYIPGLSPTRVRDLQISHGYCHEIFNAFKKSFGELFKAKYLLFPSAYELEPKAIDFFTSKFDFPVYATGPLIPFEDISVGNDGNEPDYIQWLDEQPESSVLYISQGSFLSVSEAQMEEIVVGVREIGVRFLWVARESDLKLKESLKGSSGVVVSWCHQLRVLCHKAVGGFWTHCGFNSTLEGIYSGVPMLAFPVSWDQFLNAKLIVDEWRVGMRIERKKKTELLIVSDEIKELVKRFMDGESEDGKEMRKRVCDLSEICRVAVAESGSSDADIDAFIKDITKIV